MTVKPIPEGYHTVTPYLVVEDADKLIAFLKAAFDAKLKFSNQDEEGKTSHAELEIGDSKLMLGLNRCGETTKAMLYLYVEDTDKYYEKALAAGATSIVKPTNQFYGDRNAGVKDCFDNQWWIGTRVEELSPEEIRQRAQANKKACA